MDTMKTLYAVYNKDCGHTIYVANERDMAEQIITQLTLAGRWGYRIKADPTDDDIACLLAGRRCETCTFDGGTQPPGFVLHVGKPGG